MTIILMLGRREQLMVDQQKPTWWDAIPHPLKAPVLVVDRGLVRKHFDTTKEVFAQRGINASHVLHLKAAVPTPEMIVCVPGDVMLIASFDNFMMTASYSKNRNKIGDSDPEFGLHLGTPSAPQDRKDKLITTPSVEEFRKKVERIVALGQGASFKKLILDGT